MLLRSCGQPERSKGRTRDRSKRRPGRISRDVRPTKRERCRASAPPEERSTKGTEASTRERPSRGRPTGPATSATNRAHRCRPARSARRNPDPAPDPPGLHRRPRGRERSGSRTRTTGDLPRAPRAGCTTSYRRRPRHRGDRRPIQGSGTPSPGAAIPTLALHACALTTSARAGCDSNQPSSGRSGQSPGRARSSATRGPFGRTPRSAHAVSFGCLIQIDRR